MLFYYLRVCVCVCVCVCERTILHPPTRTDTHTQTHTRTDTYTHTHTHNTPSCSRVARRDCGVCEGGCRHCDRGLCSQRPRLLIAPRHCRNLTNNTAKIPCRLCVILPVLCCCFVLLCLVALLVGGVFISSHPPSPARRSGRGRGITRRKVKEGVE